MNRVAIINSRQKKMKKIQEEVNNLDKKRGELIGKYNQLELNQLRDLRLGDNCDSSIGKGHIIGLTLCTDKQQVCLYTAEGKRELNDIGSLRIMEEKS